MAGSVAPEQIEAELTGTVRVIGVPRWLWLAAYVLMLSLGTGAKIFLRLPVSRPVVGALEAMPYVMIWAPIMLIAVLLSPLMILRHGARTWLLVRFPAVVALTWDARGVTLSDGRLIQWREISYISRLRQRRIPYLAIHNDAFGPVGKVCIPEGQLLDPQQAFEELTAAHHHYRLDVAKSDYADKFEAAQKEARRRLVETYGKTASQLKAEGLPTDAVALSTQFATEAINRAFRFKR